MDLLREKMRLLPLSGPQDSGGGGGGAATQTQVTDLPEWAKPYAEKTLAKTEALTTDKPYQSYAQWAGGKGLNPSQVAGFTGLQQKAFEGAQGMQTSPDVGTAAGIASAAALQGLGMGYDPYQARNQYRSIAGYQPTQFVNPYEAPADYQAAGFQNRFAAPSAYQAAQFSADQVAGPQLSQYQMGPAERVRTDTFGGRQAAQYMSPYIEEAMQPQLREAARASDIQRNINQAQAVQQGAFGGSRQAIVEAERQRNLATQQGDIRAKGLQSAYEQAQAQFNQDAARRLQAQQLNQQAGLTVGQQNLAALLGTQQLGAQTGLQAQLANQQAAMQAQQLAEQSRQFGAGQGLSAAQLQAQYGLSADQAAEASRQFAANQAAQRAQTQAQYGLATQQAQEAAGQFGYGQAAQQAAQRAQYGQAAQQLAEQSRQYGAGLGLQGLQTALTGAGQLGNLGGQQFQQAMDINKLQQAYGTQQQQLNQAQINQLVQDYQAQQKYPYQQLEFMSNILRGTPMGTVQSLYSNPSAVSQLAGLGTAAYGASRLAGMKEGGTVKAASGGLMDLAVAELMGGNE